MKYKKGSHRDNLFIIVLAFILAVAGIFSIAIMQRFNTAFQNLPDTSAQARTTVNIVNTRLPRWVEGLCLVLYVVLNLVSIFLALFVPSNPAFFPISLIVFLAVNFIANLLKTIYSRIVASTALASAGAAIPVTVRLMDRLPLFSLVFGVILVIVLVSKR